jgi:hypothetical protein
MQCNRPHERQTLFHQRLRTLLLSLYSAHTPPALPPQPKAPPAARGLKRAQGSGSSSGQAPQRRRKISAAAEDSESDAGNSDTEGSSKAGATSSEAASTDDDANSSSSSSSGKKPVRKGTRVSDRVVRGTAQSAVAAAAALKVAAPTCAVVGNQPGNERLLTAIRSNNYRALRELYENVSCAKVSLLRLMFVHNCRLRSY